MVLGRHRSIANPSFRRKPESRKFAELDTGVRQCDEYFGVSVGHHRIEQIGITGLNKRCRLR